MFKRDLFLAPTLEAALVMIVALGGWASHQPMIFASLGPTAFEMIETPTRPSARPYSILMGNVIAVLASFFALWVTRAWFVPAVSASGVPWLRVWSATLAALLTVLGTLLARATQPAAPLDRAADLPGHHADMEGWGHYPGGRGAYDLDRGTGAALAGGERPARFQIESRAQR